MRIDVTYADAPPRVIETSGEAMLSSSTVAGSPEWRGRGLPVTAVALRPRTDIATSGGGLVVELCAWSASEGGGGDPRPVDDFYGERAVPRLAFHTFRAWEVLPASDVARAIDIEVDGRVHLARVAGRLLDLTAHERVEGRLLSQAERFDRPLDQRVLLVHDRLRWQSPDLDDAALGDLYGLGAALHDWAVGMAGATCDGGEGAGPEPADGLGDLVSALAGAAGREGRVAALADAILDDPGLTLAALRHAVAARGADLGDLDGLWSDAEEEADGFAGL